MKKGFVLVDTSDSCKDCEKSCYVRNIRTGEYMYRCTIVSKTIPKLKEKPDWCPIKSFPERKPLYSENGGRPIDWEFNVGWNACLNKIEQIINGINQ